MHYRICLALLAVTLAGGTALAANQAPPQQNSPATESQFQGTPEEQKACAPDTTRYCSEDVPDTFKVLACLQDHREKLRKVCLKVLEDHGQ